jgi:hypothetical protein
MSLVRGGRKLHWAALFFASGIWVSTGSMAMALDEGPWAGGFSATPLAISGIPAARAGVGFSGPSLWGAYGSGDAAVHAWINEQSVVFRDRNHRAMGYGTLGYGGAGLYPGFYGFGLSFHLGYGYGGWGLGVGAGGGYPNYGGPGYPHCGSLYDGPPAGLVQIDGGMVYGRVQAGGAGYPSPARTGAQQPGPVDDRRGAGAVSVAANLGDYGPYTGATLYPFTHRTPTAEAAATGTVHDPFSMPEKSDQPAPGGER